DSAPSPLPQTALTTGTFKPADYPPTEPFPAPAPPGPYAKKLSAFNGQSSEGAWALYVFDSGAPDHGSFAGGWSLTVTTVSATGAPPTITDIPDQSIPINTATAPIPFTIDDPDTPVSGLTLSTNSSNLSLVPLSNIVLAGTGHNRTVKVTP